MNSLPPLRLALPGPPRPPRPVAGMEGTNPHGIKLEVNSSHLELAGRPWIPVMGEFQFSRYPDRFWREELLKMKSGGINLIATYLFWIHHEEVRGEFDWSGSRNLRRFVELCGELGLYCFPRIGPWVHGEARRGGHPDWVESEGIAWRTRQPSYLDLVDRFYEQVGAQLRGLLWQDGGPVIGIQIENEHCAHGPDVGAAYLLALKKLAQKHGMVVPLYTMTGWGSPEVPQGEIIPVFGGYPDSMWDDWQQRIQSPNYSFSHSRWDGGIGTDWGLRESRELAEGDNPYLTCEIGPGMIVSYHRRPCIEPGDVVPISLVKLGSGGNLPGYYVFHGGTNPRGRYSRLHEDYSCGLFNDVPVFSYDFQAPLGEFGQVREHFFHYLPLHLFVSEFGDRLAPLPTVVAPDTAAAPFDNTRLKWAVRAGSQSGFLFFNNYVRNFATRRFDGVQFTVSLESADVTLPSVPVSIPPGACGIWPIGLRMDEARLCSATVQPVCQIEGARTWVFCQTADIPVELVFEAATILSVQTPPGGTIRRGPQWVVGGLVPGFDCVLRVQPRQAEPITVVILTEQQARTAYKHRGTLFLVEGGVSLWDGDHLDLVSSAPTATIRTLPPLGREGRPEEHRDGRFGHCTLETGVPAARPLSWRTLREAERIDTPYQLGRLDHLRAPADDVYDRGWHIELDLPPDLRTSSDAVLVRVDYVGDCGRLFVGGEFVHDHFYNGQPWEFDLRHFAPGILTEPVVLKLLPWRRDAPIYLDQPYRPDGAAGDQVLHIRSMVAVVSRRVRWASWPRSAPSSELTGFPRNG